MWHLALVWVGSGIEKALWTLFEKMGPNGRNEEEGLLGFHPWTGRDVFQDLSP